MEKKIPSMTNIQNSQTLNTVTKMNLKHEDVAQYFHLPLLQASIKLGIDLSDLKKEMKRLGIERWPYSYKRESNKQKEDLKMFSDFKVCKIEKKPQKTNFSKVDRMKITNLID